MTVTLVLPDPVRSEIEAILGDPLEVGGVLLAALEEGEGGHIRLLARGLRLVTPEAYVARERDRMTIRPEGYVAALAEAEALGAVPIWFHTHPGMAGIPRPSLADRDVDVDIADLFRLRADTPWYATLIMSPRREGFAFTGALHHENGTTIPVERIWAVGETWQLTAAFDAAQTEIPAMFDRNVRAFGGDVQRVLGDLRVAIVGCGGTGSAVAEQLVRLGVRKLMLFDADKLNASNVTRVYGSMTADVGRLKCDILASHLRRVAPDLLCETFASMITLEPAARRLAEADLIFGCTDDNAGRLVLSRLSSYMLIPVVDVGVLLSTGAKGVLIGIDGRVTILSPGSACLVCRDRIDFARARAEGLSPSERKRLADEGYAPALGGVEPAVVAFTTAVAAAAVGELLERLIGYGPDPRPSELLLRFHDREISGNRAAPRAGHYCDVAARKLGAGGGKPFLDQVWPE